MCMLRASGSTAGPKTFSVIGSAVSFSKTAGTKNKEEERRLSQLVASAFSEVTVTRPLLNLLFVVARRQQTLGRMAH